MTDERCPAYKLLVKKLIMKKISDSNRKKLGSVIQSYLLLHMDELFVEREDVLQAIEELSKDGLIVSPYDSLKGGPRWSLGTGFNYLKYTARTYDEFVGFD